MIGSRKCAAAKQGTDSSVQSTSRVPLILSLDPLTVTPTSHSDSKAIVPYERHSTPTTTRVSRDETGMETMLGI